jgi:hypothetical protein
MSIEPNTVDVPKNEVQPPAPPSGQLRFSAISIHKGNAAYFFNRFRKLIGGWIANVFTW